jgi:pilus assembly protein Flp/PilA
MRFLKSKKGQSLVEYMVIVALMAVATMGIMRVLSKTTSGKLAQITQSLQGGKANISVEFERIEQDDLRKKDMSNFFRGSRSRQDR